MFHNDEFNFKHFKYADVWTSYERFSMRDKEIEYLRGCSKGAP